jgi:hypothetical protein
MVPLFTISYKSNNYFINQFCVKIIKLSSNFYVVSSYEDIFCDLMRLIASHLEKNKDFYVFSLNYTGFHKGLIL